MAYVSEYISKEDLEKYNFKWINDRGTTDRPSDQWTIDRERDMWLRTYYRSIDRDNNGEENYTIWNFWWKGYLIDVKTITIDARSARFNDGEMYKKYEILNLVIPNEVKDQKEQILKDLKDIFEGSFCGAGVYRDPDIEKTCKVDLEYEGRMI